MKTTKLVLGIISCVIVMFVLFQSCAAGMYNALEENNGMSGSVGVIFAILLLAAGIIAIVTHKKLSGGGTLASVIIYVLAGVIAIAGHGTYSDLMVWGPVSIAIGILFMLFYLKGRKKDTAE